jgi:hypothetical protein
MARRKPTEETPLARLPAVGVSIPIGQQQPTVTEERREREWEELVDAVGTDGRIRVWHIIQGKSIWAGEMTTDGFSLDTLMDTYGGGDKSLVFYQGKQKVDTLRVSLDPSIPVRNPRSPPAPVGAVAPASSGAADFTPMIAAMSAMMAASAQNSAEILRGVVALITTRPPERDPMDLVTKVLEVTKPVQSTPATELFSVFEKGMSMANALRGDDDGTLAIAKEGLGIVGKIVEGQNLQRRAPAAALPPGANPRSGGAGGEGGAIVGRIHNAPPVAHGAGSGSGGPAQGATETPMVSVRPWVDAARPAAGYLLLAMGQFRPPTVADMIADRLDDAAFSDLIQDIEAGTPAEFLDRFRGYFGIPAEQFTDEMVRWMLELVQSVKELVGDLEGEDLPPEPSAA